MKIVVITRNAEPIDLTASIIKAKTNINNGLSCSVEWIVENSASTSEFYELQRIASEFKELNIRVNWQKDISMLNPDKKTIISLLQDILSYIDTTTGMIRIHHGAIVLDIDSSLIYCRYFGWKNGKLLLCDNKKNPKFYFVDEDDAQKLFFHGSMNLCLIKNYGEFAHLPWYCIDSAIYPFTVEEIITPPEGCSSTRFDSGAKRLIPSGYSIYNYFTSEKSLILTIEECLHEFGSVINSRQKNGTRCAKSLIIKISRNIQSNIKNKGFYKYLHNLENDSKKTTDIIIKMLEIWVMSKIMISYDRGYIDEVRDTGLIVNDELLVSKEKILEVLVNAANSCSKKINLNSESFSDLLLSNDKTFGVLANRIFDMAIQYFNCLFYDLFYNNKATFPNLLEYCNRNNFNNGFLNTIVMERNSQITQVVEGSIFEFEDFPSLESRMVKHC